MTSPASVSTNAYSAMYVSFPDDKYAKRIAKQLVKEKLAASVNIIPKVTSMNMWNGEFNQEGELLLMIKTRSSKVPELTAYVESNHPNELCEVIVVPIIAGNKSYFDWVDEVLHKK